MLGTAIGVFADELDIDPNDLPRLEPEVIEKLEVVLQELGFDDFKLAVENTLRKLMS